MLPKRMRQQLNGHVRMPVAGFLPAQIKGLEDPAHASRSEFGFQDKAVPNHITNADRARSMLSQRRIFVVAQGHV